MSPTAGHPVVVIGAGIVGICCAAYLVRGGASVVLIDRRGPGEQTSFGNAGGIQDLATTPIALPGLLRELPKWLGDPNGPLHVRWRYLPKAVPWLLRFVRESAETRVWHNAKALNELNRHCREALMPLVKWAGVEDLIRIPGQLYLDTSRASFAPGSFTEKLRQATGLPYEVIEREEIARLEPALSPVFELGLRIPGNGHCRNPFKLATAFAERSFRDGVEFLRAEVNGFELRDGAIAGVQTDRGIVKAGAIVVAAGMWSKPLVRALGYEVPLESHRGYHVTINNPGVTLNNMCLVLDKKIAITPMEMGLRIAGTVEIAGLDELPHYERARAFLDLGRELIPGLVTDDYTEWMGHRPCFPDSLPVIDRSKRIRNAFFAFGHGHMGLLGAAPTGRTIAELVLGRSPSIDIAPFAIDRF